MEPKLKAKGSLFYYYISPFIVWSVIFSCARVKDHPSVNIKGREKFNGDDTGNGTGNGPGNGGAVVVVNDPKTQADFENFQLVIKDNCVSCHGGVGSSHPNTSNFKPLDSIEKWIASGHLVPGSPERSTVYNRLIFAPKTLGTQRDMPLGGEEGKMTSEDAQNMYSFIQGIKVIEQGNTLALLGNFSAVNKIRYILHGGPFSQDDLSDIEALDGSNDDSKKREIIRKMIVRWMADEKVEKKLIQFLIMALQQDGKYDRTRGSDTLFGRVFPGPNGQLWQENVFESSRRTFRSIINSNKPFTEILTVSEFYMTTALLSSLLFADDVRKGVVPLKDQTSTFKSFIDKDNLKDSDFNDWRLIKFTQDSSGSNLTYTQVPQIRSLKENATVTLRTPRIGFFTTLGFQLRWKTNDDNQFRTTVNQTLISSLNRAISGSDPSSTFSDETVDKEHAADKKCYACHRIMDPIRGVFAKEFGFDYRSRNENNSSDDILSKKTGFSFMEKKGPASSISDLAKLLAEHPLFAQAWVEKLCHYANSAACDTTDPEFQKLVTNFKQSNLDFKKLVIDTFSSPIVLEQGKSSKKYGPSIARRTHFCSAINSRYQAMSKSQGKQPSVPDLCELKSIKFVIIGIPEEFAKRGEAGFVMNRKSDAFLVRMKEKICEGIAKQIVGKDILVKTESEREKSLDGLVKFFMNIPSNHQKYKPMRAIFGELFAGAKQKLGIDKAAMSQAFTLACTSLELGGVGI